MRLWLDHVDVKGNIPERRTLRFLDQAFEEETITHIT